MSEHSPQAMADRVVAQAARQRWRSGEQPPTRAQVAMVLHALADHTLLETARAFNRDYRPGLVDERWPSSLSTARFFHRMADSIEDGLS